MPHGGDQPGQFGGPLVDRCGRVVGINTFRLLQCAEQGERVSYAQKEDLLIAFLTANGVAVTELTGRAAGGGAGAGRGWWWGCAGRFGTGRARAGTRGTRARDARTGGAGTRDAGGTDARPGTDPAAGRAAAPRWSGKGGTGIVDESLIATTLN